MHGNNSLGATEEEEEEEEEQEEDGEDEEEDDDDDDLDRGPSPSRPRAHVRVADARVRRAGRSFPLAAVVLPPRRGARPPLPLAAACVPPCFRSTMRSFKGPGPPPL